MLLTAFVLLVIGFSLVYAGVKTGPAWKKPWTPITDQLHFASKTQQNLGA